MTSQSPPIAVIWEHFTLVYKIVQLTMNGIRDSFRLTGTIGFQGRKIREKANLRLAKMYLMIFNIRQDTLHKTTTYLAKNNYERMCTYLGHRI